LDSKNLYSFDLDDFGQRLIIQSYSATGELLGQHVPFKPSTQISQFSVEPDDVVGHTASTLDFYVTD